MKISICSDLHLEFGALHINNTDNSDVLILSGDVLVASDLSKKGQRCKQALSFFENVCSQWKHVVYVMGNHEHYNGFFSQTKDILSTRLPFDNLHILDKSFVTINNVTFIGATLWTDMDNNNWFVKHHLRQHMNDFSIIMKNDGTMRFTPDDALKEHREAMLFFEQHVPNFDNVVVVTHHAPSLLSIHPKYQNEILMNRGYVSDISSFIMKHQNIKLWTHGHVHNTHDYYIGNTRIVCNPRGYAGYEQQANNFNLTTVEI